VLRDLRGAEVVHGGTVSQLCQYPELTQIQRDNEMKLRCEMPRDEIESCEWDEEVDISKRSIQRIDAFPNETTEPRRGVKDSVKLTLR